MKKITLGIMPIIFLIMNFLPLALADEITVSNNGEGSNNNVSIESTNTSTVEQTNNAQVENQVDVNANTGDNSASENNGDASITTGDANVSSNIENSVNASVIDDLGCCSGDLTVKVSGNGANSQNSVTQSQNNNTNISVSNTANVTNNVTGSANTGYNNANANSGSVSITTGDIKASDTIKNKGINIYSINALAGNGGSVSLFISDNGVNSNNSLNFNNDSSVVINVVNSANIINDSKWDLNTGGNEANYNLGDVIIATGDIYFDSYIENGPINTGIIDVDCCDTHDDDGDGDGDDDDDDDGNGVKPPDGTKPTNGGGNGDGLSDGRSDGRSSGAVLGAILPATGTMWLYLITLAAFMMLLMGWYLRRSSGSSPPAYLYA